MTAEQACGHSPCDSQGFCEIYGGCAPEQADERAGARQNEWSLSASASNEMDPTLFAFPFSLIGLFWVVTSRDAQFYAKSPQMRRVDRRFRPLRRAAWTMSGDPARGAARPAGAG